MAMNPRFWGSAIVLLCSPCALADSGAAAAVTDGEHIVVTANRLAVQNLIDRKVYSIAADLQSITGTVSDVLAVIPSVQLDVDGLLPVDGDFLDPHASSLYSTLPPTLSRISTMMLVGITFPPSEREIGRAHV